MIPRRQNPSTPTHKAPNVMKRTQETVLPSTSPLRSSQPAQKRPATRSLPTRNFYWREFGWSRWGILVNSDIPLDSNEPDTQLLTLDVIDPRNRTPSQVDEAVKEDRVFFLNKFYLSLSLVNTVRMWYEYIWKYNIKKVVAIVIPVTDMYRRPSKGCEKWTAHLW